MEEAKSPLIAGLPMGGGAVGAVSGHPIRERRSRPRALIESEIRVAELCGGPPPSSTSVVLSSPPRAAISLRSPLFLLHRFSEC